MGDGGGREEDVGVDVGVGDDDPVELAVYEGVTDDERVVAGVTVPVDVDVKEGSNRGAKPSPLYIVNGQAARSKMANPDVPTSEVSYATIKFPEFWAVGDVVMSKVYEAPVVVGK